ncbi:precorrin-6y C5,15-methyltransferase (decarboxylating) subunit CbiE [Salinisphaera sp. SPP-AMP-43]|uniref:precorrin-6y C5,15-methyltransferase (decarboxylating) subunit CbiE n=1 Tax=Salinisphaera sp. SPP-AMP-43 TaxID=3121288 RepID=UPI003C6E84F3
MCRHTDSSISPWLSIVGIGEDGWSGLTPSARSAVENADYLMGGARHLAMLPGVDGQRRERWPSPLLDGIDGLCARRGSPVTVLATGDPFWFGVGATLARYIAPEEMAVFPQPSAFSWAAARLGWALQHVHCVSAHGRDLAALRPYLHDGRRLLLLSWDASTPDAVARMLCEAGFEGSRMTVLEHLGGDKERALSAIAAEWSYRDIAALNMVAVDCVAGEHARSIPRTAGRAEALFAHDGQISKAEVRAVVLSLLAPGRGERLWDIGAGSGAVGIEWMLADPANRTIAVEARAERASGVAGNAERLGVPALACIHGQAPEALADLEAPDAIFIGGGLTVDGLLAHCLARLVGRPRTRLVATSVTVEGDAVLAEAMQRHGGSLRRIAIERAEPLGRLTGWAPARPITIWCWSGAC